MRGTKFDVMRLSFTSRIAITDEELEGTEPTEKATSGCRAGETHQAEMTKDGLPPNECHRWPARRPGRGRYRRYALPFLVRASMSPSARANAAHSSTRSALSSILPHGSARWGIRLTGHVSSKAASHATFFFERDMFFFRLFSFLPSARPDARSPKAVRHHQGQSITLLHPHIISGLLFCFVLVVVDLVGCCFFLLLLSSLRT